ncbi:p450 domain-containing protein [Cephalotus follicularis]|uniref:p450 domain-containing protein n=1 Tax=Cephalotus follicularis TaxID=3775 RepID=A0A1Q3BZW2_CEPFO|nr:p450 domain-containing protein [Cephalotus follicularis]
MPFVGFFEIVVAVICYLIFRCLSNNNGLPTNFPVVGMMPDLLLNYYNLHDWATETIKRNHTFTFLFKGPWFSNLNILTTVDPANVHHIMSTNFSNYPKGPQYKEIFDILGEGIFNSDADMWKNQRKILTGLVNHKRFYNYLVRTIWNKLEKGLLTVLEHVSENGLMVDLQDLFHRFTFDSACILVTGYDPGCLSIEFPEVQFSSALDDAEESIYYRYAVPESVWKLQRWIGIGHEKKMSKARETLDHILAKYISMKREEVNKGNRMEDDGEGVDILTSCMSERDILGLETDDKFLRDIILNFMIAGSDTTSAALSWFFWILSQNPKVESKIREELKSKTSTKDNENGGLFDIEELKGLVYLHAALCETLRLYPPVPFEHKAPLMPDILPSGHRVVPKSKILILLYSMGRMPSIWGEDCLEFKPERWITEKGGIKHEPSYKFFAFNAGPRTCLGKDVAFTQMKAVAAAIIHNYHFDLVNDHPVVPRLSVILHMKHGLKVKVTKRRSVEY